MLRHSLIFCVEIYCYHESKTQYNGIVLLIVTMVPKFSGKSCLDLKGVGG